MQNRDHILPPARGLPHEQRNAWIREIRSDHRLIALRCAAWLCVGLITYWSLIPQIVEVWTFVPGGIERAIAYGSTAGILMLAYPRTTWLIVGSLSAHSGLMELLQNLSFGRHPSVAGVFWSSAGAIIGALVIALLGSMRAWISPPDERKATIHAAPALAPEGRVHSGLMSAEDTAFSCAREKGRARGLNHKMDIQVAHDTVRIDVMVVGIEELDELIERLQHIREVLRTGRVP
jgi:hypothetical protein